VNRAVGVDPADNPRLVSGRVVYDAPLVAVRRLVAVGVGGDLPITDIIPPEIGRNPIDRLLRLKARQVLALEEGD
jgi:hypothetical protein